MSIEEERDEWMMDETQPRVVHTLAGTWHRVQLISQDHDEGAREHAAEGVGRSYQEALLVGLRNWQSKWGSSVSR